MLKQTTRHDDARGGLAVYVKTHGMRLVDGGTEAQREEAYELATFLWWRDAGDIAKRCGYSGAAACGRMGGWCAPYDEVDGRTMPIFEEDENSQRFVAFRSAISQSLDAAPQLFADTLAQVIADDAQREKEEADAAALQALRDAMPAKLADALRMALDVDIHDDDNAQERAHAVAVLAEYERLNAGAVTQAERYLVSWMIDSDADTPEAAARAAWRDMRRRDSIACVFDVRDKAGHVTRVDLMAQDGDA